MKYYGKEKCRILKEIRAEIARQNGIAWTVESCAHKGNCRGTCPKCEAEVVALEKALEDLPVDEADKNRIARLSAELMAQAEQYAVELGVQAYLEFARSLTPEMSIELERHKDNEVPET